MQQNKIVRIKFDIYHKLDNSFKVRSVQMQSKAVDFLFKI